MSCTAYILKGFAVIKDAACPFGPGSGGGGGGIVVAVGGGGSTAAGFGGGGGGAFAFFLRGGTGTAPDGELVASAPSTSELDCPELRRDDEQEKSRHTSLVDDSLASLPPSSSGPSAAGRVPGMAGRLAVEQMLRQHIVAVRAVDLLVTFQRAGNCFPRRQDIVGSRQRRQRPRMQTNDIRARRRNCLVGKLQDKGLNIARRTVAKYREELGILPSNLRRDYT